MTDTDILRKALARYRAATGENTVFKDDVIVFLEKEIDRYSGAFRHMEYNVKCMKGKNDELKARLNAIYGVQTSGAITEQLEGWKSSTAAVQELSEKHNALIGRVDRLGDIVENKLDQLFGDTVQTLTTFTEDRTSDGGTMTLTTNRYEEVQDILLCNGYYVVSHIDDEANEHGDETITIEFWRA